MIAGFSGAAGQGLNVMASKVTFALAAIVSLVICGATSCKEPPNKGLQFVGKGRPEIKQSAPKGLVIVTHGWIEKGRGDWAEDMAKAIAGRVDANDWICGYFDWSDGAETINPTDAARFARDVAGPQLARQILKTDRNWRHIHLLGHSCGCWVVSEAAKILAKETQADVHLTFFDAYVPARWDEESLADVNASAEAEFWAEQYYTRDLTLKWTQHNLRFAHNVDISAVNGVVKDHNFPWQWYFATVSGKYPRQAFLHKGRPICVVGGLEYGFARSREAGGADSWEKSLRLPTGNEAVELTGKR